MTTRDRRRFERIRPTTPIQGVVGRAKVYVLDASIGGVGLLHENALPAPGDICRVEIQSEMGTITLDCEVVRTMPHSSGQTASVAKPLSESGLRVVSADHQSAQRLRNMFGQVAAKRGHSQDN